MSVPDENQIELEALEALAGRISDLDLLKGAPPEFNVFEAMGVIFQEVRHSDFLAFLLDPQGQHGLGDSFTKGWLKRVIGPPRSHTGGNEGPDALPVRPNLLERLDCMGMSGTRVYRERHRIDILLVDQTNRLAVVIENKILSGEHSDQLARYRQIAEQRYPGSDILCVFLTPGGEAPSHGGYVSADYEGVCEELESIIEEAVLPDGTPIDQEVHFALSHYARLLRRNIVANSEVAELARRLYLEHRSAFELVYAHRYLHQKRLRGVLIKLINQTPGQMWDVPTLHCAREDCGGRGALVLSFVFDN
jgi:hypothetical protein